MPKKEDKALKPLITKLVHRRVRVIPNVIIGHSLPSGKSIVISSPDWERNLNLKVVFRVLLEIDVVSCA